MSINLSELSDYQYLQQLFYQSNIRKTKSSLDRKSLVACKPSKILNSSQEEEQPLLLLFMYMTGQPNEQSPFTLASNTRHGGCTEN